MRTFACRCAAMPAAKASDLDSNRTIPKRPAFAAAAFSRARDDDENGSEAICGYVRTGMRARPDGDALTAGANPSRRARRGHIGAILRPAIRSCGPAARLLPRSRLSARGCALTSGARGEIASNWIAISLQGSVWPHDPDLIRRACSFSGSCA